MLAVGMLLMWAGYATGLEGWCLFRDYNVTLGQLMSPLHPYDGPWPPAKIPSGQTWPGGVSAASGGQGPARAAPGPAGPGGRLTSRASIGSRITRIVSQLPGLGFIK